MNLFFHAFDSWSEHQKQKLARLWDYPWGYFYCKSHGPLKSNDIINNTKSCSIFAEYSRGVTNADFHSWITKRTKNKPLCPIKLSMTWCTLLLTTHPTHFKTWHEECGGYNIRAQRTLRTIEIIFEMFYFIEIIVSTSYLQKHPSMTSTTSKMEFFVILVKPITIVTKCPISGVADVLDTFLI